MNRCWLLLALLLLAAAPVTAQAEVLVSLGDSYSSGEGAGSYDREAGSCHRSPNAWPRVLGVDRALHFACSGARSVNVDGVPQKRSGVNSVPQIQRLREAVAASPVGTVLLTAGGNDLHFKAKLLECRFSPSRCMSQPQSQADELAKLASRLTGLYRAIAGTPGVGRLVVVGYPEIAPDGSETVRRCSWLRRAEVRERIARFTSRLDDTLASAASKAGVTYVSVRDALDGHELCTKRPWMFSVVGRRHILSQQQGHPTEEGQRAIAAEVGARLARAATSFGPSLHGWTSLSDSGWH